MFDDTCGREAFGFDAAGQVNFYEAQHFICKHVAIDGDFFGQFVKSNDGRALMRFIGGESVGNATTGLAQDEWQDGVRTDQYGKPTQYRLLADEGRSTFTDVNADDILHFHRPARIGYTRSPSWLSRAALHLHDMADIVAFTKQTFKLASQPAFIIKSPDAMQVGMGAALKKQDAATGSVTLDKLYGGSGVVQLPPGTELQQFKNEHPGNNFQAFLDFLARDISWGIGLSPEMLWSVAGIGGANTRYVLADAQVFFSELQDWIINQFCRRFWKYWVWSEIQAGRLPLRDDWWRVDFIPPARATVDFGRDTKALIEIVRTGAMSTRRFAEMQAGRGGRGRCGDCCCCSPQREVRSRRLGRHRCFPARARITGASAFGVATGYRRFARRRRNGRRFNSARLQRALTLGAKHGPKLVCF